MRRSKIAQLKRKWMKRKANGQSESVMRILRHGEREKQAKTLKVGKEIKGRDASTSHSNIISAIGIHLLSSNLGAPLQYADQPVKSDLAHQDVGVNANMHVIDQGIHDIAKEFRFTIEEVQEYYDKCGEMGRTRTRFQKMRHELQLRFMDDDK
jgi:hypothetical protein